jgi:uncharacterized membrane protein
MSSAQHTSPPTGSNGIQLADKPPSPLFPADNSAVTTHMNMLQGVINRLATQSSSCKTWCLTVVGGMLGLAGSTKIADLAWLALVPVLTFMLLDAYYLACERAFRQLWDAKVERVRAGLYELADTFEMKPSMSTSLWLKTLLSSSILPVYLGLAGACVLARIYLDRLVA